MERIKKIRKLVLLVILFGLSPITSTIFSVNETNITICTPGTYSAVKNSKTICIECEA
jgi:predicted transcriptional regulator